MSWKKVGSGEMIDFKRDGKGTETIGKFLGSDANAGEFGGTAHHIEIDGVKHTGFGSAVLNNRLANVKPGTLVKIVYMGQEKGKKYPNPMHMYEVFEDDGSDGADESAVNTDDIPF